MTSMLFDYKRRIIEVIRGIQQKAPHNDEEKEVARVIIESSSLRINRKTRDLELCVTGALERRDGVAIKGEYMISIAMWNYSKAVPQGIEQETYEEVMSEEREALLASYIRAYVNISDKEPVGLTREEYLKREGEGLTVEYHPLLQELINRQANVYAKMRTRQSKKEIMKAEESEEITAIVRAAEARPTINV